MYWHTSTLGHSSLALQTQSKLWIHIQSRITQHACIKQTCIHSLINLSVISTFYDLSTTSGTRIQLQCTFVSLKTFFPQFCDFSRFVTCRNPVCMCYKWCLMSRNNGITLSKTASLLCSLSSVISSALRFLKMSKSRLLIIMGKCSTGTQKTTSTRWANAQTSTFTAILCSHFRYTINHCQCLAFFMPLYNRKIAHVSAFS